MSTVELPAIIEGFERAQNTTNPGELVNIINTYRLPREAIPTEMLTNPTVQEALLQHMPLTAMIRNLGNMSKSGLLVPFSDAEKLVVGKLSNQEDLISSRVHPFAVLLAVTTYNAGQGVRGHGTWTPVGSVVDALNEAFYDSFGNVTPIGNNVLLALDVSGSMMSQKIHDSHLSAAMASCAMAMITARTEPSWAIGAFSDGSGRYSGVWSQIQNPFSIMAMSAKESLPSLLRRTQDMGFGGTDCAIPMIAAEQNEMPIDTFIIYTDSETWAGHIHPVQALKSYRKRMNKPNAKLIVVGLTATKFSIADPNDPGMLDVVGFDALAPNIISVFARES